MRSECLVYLLFAGLAFAQAPPRLHLPPPEPRRNNPLPAPTSPPRSKLRRMMW